MITISELRAIASNKYLGETIGFSRILSAWCEENPEEELSGYLQNTGLTVQTMAKTLEQFDDDSGKELLIQCLTSVTGESVKGVHLLQTICDNKGHKITAALIGAGLDCKTLSENIKDSINGKTVFSTISTNIDVEIDTSEGEQSSVLLKYGRDLTALALEGNFDELCDRPEEIERLLDVILRKRKGNPVLTGAAGIGKTALVELLASKIIEQQSPLHNYKLFEISMGKLVAGTKYRGEFESRFEGIMSELEQSSPALLFIDEVHLLFGAGRAEGAAMDAANLLKPYLARDDLKVIGATTSAEYQRYIVSDKALARRFQEIKLEEPNGEMLHSMVKQQALSLSQHHQVEISDEVIDKAIELTDKHLPNRQQPDKTIDLLDSAAVVTRREDKEIVTFGQLLSTMAKITGTSVGVLSGEDRSSLRNLANALKKRVVGQEQAIEKVVSGIVHRKMDIGQTDRPLGVFLLAGSTGVGKTELSKAVAAEFFGNEKKIVHIDLGEHSGPGAVNSIIGAPNGYVGSENDGVLIKGIQDHNSCVIVLDEIEKAHPDVHRLLLGLLDNGRISSGKGELYDARQCAIFLTTNALTDADIDKPSMGFSNIADKDPLEMLSDTFPKEFLGRMDEVILFNSLKPKDLRNILKLRLQEADVRLSNKGICLKYDEKTMLDHLLNNLTKEKTGARGIARLLERKLLQPLAMALLDSEADKIQIIELGAEYFRDGIISSSVS